MSEPTQKAPKKSKSGIIILVVLISIFALPEIIAVGLQAIKWRPKTTTNQGQLVQPTRAITNLDLEAMDKTEVKFSNFRQKWTVIYFADAECDDLCIKNLYIMRQVHKALGKEQARMHRIFVPLGEVSGDKLGNKIKDYPGMTVLTGPRQNIELLAQQFVLPNAKSVDPQRIYLVDPLGNLMMSYQDNPSGLLKDLRHLMKTSWAG